MCNIAGAGAQFRDLCLQKDCMNQLLRILERFPTSQNIVDQSIYGISNLCQGKPFPQWEQILPALPVLYKQISEVTSQRALEKVLWTLKYITDNGIILEIFS